ncbi:MAG: hypothetical protein N2444_04015, partial [Methylocystis sp.]|nr:hypothetical protein [Methylocystis sp.]
MSEEFKPKEVRITQREAVGWFDPRALFTSALNAVVSALVGERTGRREILAALDTPIQQPNTPHLISRGPEGYHDHSKEAGKGGQSFGEEQDAFWFDYVADLGDGFNATYSVAWLIGRDYVYLKNKGVEVEQPLPPAPNKECGADALGPGYVALPAGSVLVMGGDQVYPFASADNYRERLYDPYFAARPWGAPDAHRDPTRGRRALYAIPGNHDWYDGLASFIRQFCQPNRWIGCWQTQQTVSYTHL